jgi:hypothetical protein
LVVFHWKLIDRMIDHPAANDATAALSRHLASTVRCADVAAGRTRPSTGPTVATKVQDGGDPISWRVRTRANDVSNPASLFSFEKAYGRAHPGHNS